MLKVYLFIYLLTCMFLMNTSGYPQAGWRGSAGAEVPRVFFLHSHQRFWLPRAKIWLERQGSKRLQGPPRCSMIGYSDVQHTCFIFIFKSIGNISIGKTEVGREWYLGCSKSLQWKSLKFKFHRFELLWPDLNEY